MVNLVEQLINEQSTLLLKSSATAERRQAMTVIILRMLTELRKWADEKLPSEAIQLQKPSANEEPPYPIASPWVDHRASRQAKRRTRQWRGRNRTAPESDTSEQDAKNDPEQIEQDIDNALLSINEWLKDQTRNDYAPIGDQIKRYGQTSRGQLIDEQY